ncbi:RidA family protein [Roseibium sp. RKSG952]|nr:RidA family protein [Roseibium sp. RKSG952]MTH95692.1 RidA family protein [Roseibium sp. RKSG952]
MSKQVYGTHPAVPLSAAVRAGEFVFLSGQVPFKPDGTLTGGDIEQQSRQVFANIKSVLAAVGAGIEDVVKTTVWLTDKSDFPRFNQIYTEYFPDAPPARSTVVSALMVDAKVEVEVVAYIL